MRRITRSVIVVGDVKKEDIVSKVEAAFGDIPAGPEIKTAKIEDEEQNRGKKVLCEKRSGTSLYCFCL